MIINYTSVLEDILEAEKNAATNKRTIKDIVLNKREWEELKEEVGHSCVVKPATEGYQGMVSGIPIRVK